MSDILAQLAAAHDKTDRTRVEVPEYGAVWFFPTLTVGDQQRIARGVKKSDETGLFINFLIEMAQADDGSRIFDVPLAQKPKLLAELHRMPVRTLQRVIIEAGGELSRSAAAEVAEIDPADLRTALTAVATDDEPITAAAIAGASDELLKRMLIDLVQAHEANGGPNG